MRSSGYGSYHGRSRFRTFLKVLIVILLVLLILAVSLLVLGVLDPYQVYSADGVRLELPFQRRGEEDPAPPATASQPLVVAPDPTHEPTPEPVRFQGVLLPRETLYDGTAAKQTGAAGANAAIFDMKADDGTLGYISALPLALEAKVSASDPALNAAIRLLNDGELYTVARVSCFRDNTLPRLRNALALRTVSGYNWRDEGDMRWLSPANGEAQAYLAGVCGELAALGFDEIVLDHAAFPTRGKVSNLRTGESYDPAQLDTALEAFYQQVRAALADYPEVKLSIVSDEAALTGVPGQLSGQSPALLGKYADRVWAGAPVQEDSDYETAMGGVPVVTIAETAGPADESWAVFSLPS